MINPSQRPSDCIVLGAGLSGLAAGYTLAKAGCCVINVESDKHIGGLAKTIYHNGFRFDLGGHRFKTDQPEVLRLLEQLLENDCLIVPRSSTIRLRGRYITYPLRPRNAIFGLGVTVAAKILLDYTLQKLSPKRRDHELVSLKDWVIRNYGNYLYKLYFQQYSEKVWGLPCEQISKDWVAQRIQCLSLSTALRQAIRNKPDPAFRTLATSFYYPKWGIGQIAKKLDQAIGNMGNRVLTNTQILRIHHQHRRIQGLVTQTDLHQCYSAADHYISSIPLTTLVNLLYPSPPSSIIQAANKLKYRDLVLVAVMLNHPRVTDQTWIYLPSKNIPFGRIHEPTNWSEVMAPPGKTLLVVEYFCFRGDNTWNENDQALVRSTIRHLVDLDLIATEQVIDSLVLRIPKAYPLFEVGYESHCRILQDYVQQFENLQSIGRGGAFRYSNMDDAMISGITAAENVLNTIQHQRLDKPERLLAMVGAL